MAIIGHFINQCVKVSGLSKNYSSAKSLYCVVKVMLINNAILLILLLSPLVVKSLSLTIELFQGRKR